MQANVPSNIEAAIWGKFVFITANSGVGLVTRAPVGVWRSHPQTWELAIRVVREVESVARGNAIPLSGNEAAAAIALLERVPPSTTGLMQRDIMEGRPSELEIQNGTVVLLGQEASVPTPVNAFTYHSLLPQEMKARGQLEVSV